MVFVMVDTCHYALHTTHRKKQRISFTAYFFEKLNNWGSQDGIKDMTNDKTIL